MDDEATGVEKWLFTQASLAEKRSSTHDRTVQALTSATEAGPGERRHSREFHKPLSLEQNSLLVNYYLCKLTELCNKCGAPSDVQWVAIVFYHRFFVGRSAMEFSPLHMIFACVHLACKTEEVHDITLDCLVEHAAALGVSSSLKAKMSALEMHLLEGISFDLLVEPKPDIALRMLSEELDVFPAWTDMIKAIAAKPFADCTSFDALVTASEDILLQWCMRTDVVLRYPVSLLLTVVFGEVLARDQGLSGHGNKVWDILQSLLESHADMTQQDTVRSMFQAARRDFEVTRSSGEVSSDIVKEALTNLPGCHKVFERLRDEAIEQHKANRKERKRRWDEMKNENRRRVPTPFSKGLAELNRRLSGAFLDDNEGEGFVIHRLREDIDTSHM